MPSAYFMLRWPLEFGGEAEGDRGRLLYLDARTRPEAGNPPLPRTGDHPRLLRPGLDRSRLGVPFGRLARQAAPFLQMPVRDPARASRPRARRAPGVPLTTAFGHLGDLDETSWSPADGTPARSMRSADPGMFDSASPDRWACDPIDAEILEKFTCWRPSEQIPIFMADSALGSEVSRPHICQSEEACRARLATERHPDVVVLDARHSGYDGSVFVDPVHLDRRGAEVLTVDLAAIMLRPAQEVRPRKTRWVVALFDRANGEELNRQDAKIARLKMKGKQTPRWKKRGRGEKSRNSTLSSSAFSWRTWRLGGSIAFGFLPMRTHHE